MNHLILKNEYCITVKQLGIKKKQRIRSSAEYAHIYELRQRVWDQHLLLFGAPNNLCWTRFGLSVSKKHGNAVRRARKKRLLREAFRLSQHEFPTGLDLILIPQKNSNATVDDYRRSLERLTKKLHKRISSSINLSS